MGAWVTYGLGSETQDLPGFVVLLSGQNAARTAASRAGAAASCRRSTRACSSGPEATRCCSSRTRTGVDRRRAARSLDALKRPEPAAPARRRRSRDRHAHRVLRDGLPDADQRAGADGHLEGAGDDPRAVRRRAGQGVVRQQLPAGAPAGRARRALRPALPPRLGPPRRHRQRRHREPPRRAVPRDRPAPPRP